MKCLIADDEPLILKDIYRTAKDVLGEDTEFFLAGNSDEVLFCIENETDSGGEIQIAFLDIEMPYQDGLETAKKIQHISPRTNIIFVTGHAKYALDALEMYVSGFIMKPVSAKNMRKAVDNLRFPIPGLYVRCFGRFEVYCGNTPVSFRRSQCREIFACLVDKRGAFVSENELRYILWSEAQDTEKKKSYVRNIISDIRAALKTCGIEDVVINNNKSCYAVNTAKIRCDLYDYLDGKITVSEAQKVSYMEQYPWAFFSWN